MTEQIKSMNEGVSRREFLKTTGLVGVGAIAGGVLTSYFFIDDEIFAMETSEGYLLVDTKKCSGCQSCMIACSIAHEGVCNMSLSRIQIMKNVFAPYPYDIVQNQCRQCPYPSCAEACPVKAIKADERTGVRIVEEGKCIGCERCIEACPFTPSRMQWNFSEKNAQKCDLCATTPYWNKEGGALGKQACIDTCPMRAIRFTSDIPEQSKQGYDVNMRNIHYHRLRLPIDDAGMQAADMVST
jgi:protein NrfC